MDRKNKILGWTTNIDAVKKDSNNPTMAKVIAYGKIIINVFWFSGTFGK